MGKRNIESFISEIELRIFRSQARAAPTIPSFLSHGRTLYKEYKSSIIINIHVTSTELITIVDYMVLIHLIITCNNHIDG